MKQFICVVSLLLIFTILLSRTISMGKAENGFPLLLPDAIRGWKVAAKDRIYNRDTLFDYIDGGAELYLSYGVKKVINRTYVKSGQPDIVVDIFDMGTSQNAYGVFSHAREEEDTAFGQGSQYAAGLLLFWKGSYYISVLTFPETGESKEAIFELAREIEKVIEKEGPLPEILTLLPQQSLIKESIRYFHHYAWLNSYCFVADQNILHIDEKTEALLAKYGERGKRCLLLLVRYSQDSDAKHAYESFAKYYLPELSKEPVVKIEDGTWTACRLTKNLLIIVFNAPVKDNALHLIEAVQKKIR